MWEILLRWDGLELADVVMRVRTVPWQIFVMQMLGGLGNGYTPKKLRRHLVVVVPPGRRSQ